MNEKFSPEFKNFQGGMNFIKGGGVLAYMLHIPFPVVN